MAVGETMSEGRQSFDQRRQFGKYAVMEMKQGREHWGRKREETCAVLWHCATNADVFIRILHPPQQH
jgi:hypothetical protein